MIHKKFMKNQGSDGKRCLQVLIEGLNLDHYIFLGNGPPLHLCRVQRGHFILDDSPVRCRENKIGNDFFGRGMVDFTGLQVPTE